SSFVTPQETIKNTSPQAKFESLSHHALNTIAWCLFGSATIIFGLTLSGYPLPAKFRHAVLEALNIEQDVYISRIAGEINKVSKRPSYREILENLGDNFSPNLLQKVTKREELDNILAARNSNPNELPPPPVATLVLQAPLANLEASPSISPQEVIKPADPSLIQTSSANLKEKEIGEKKPLPAKKDAEEPPIKTPATIEEVARSSTPSIPNELEAQPDGKIKSENIDTSTTSPDDGQDKSINVAVASAPVQTPQPVEIQPKPEEKETEREEKPKTSPKQVAIEDNSTSSSLFAPEDSVELEAIGNDVASKSTQIAIASTPVRDEPTEAIENILHGFDWNHTRLHFDHLINKCKDLTKDLYGCRLTKKSWVPSAKFIIAIFDKNAGERLIGLQIESEPFTTSPMADYSFNQTSKEIVKRLPKETPVYREYLVANSDQNLLNLIEDKSLRHTRQWNFIIDGMPTY
ncbi:MAG: hypothetical protein R3261_14095, partial [Alphaproteobacteria bacterium]|nr:hypothetical protein [Alphaproteobacteria bacterium]